MGNLYESQSEQSFGNSFYEKKVKSFFSRNRYQKKLEGPIFKMMRRIQLTSIIFCLLPVLLLKFDQYALQQTSMSRFNRSFDDYGEQNYLTVVKEIFDVLSGFMVNLPYLGYLCMEGVVIFHKYFVNWDVHLVPA